ncbi:MAG TPA: class I SAM-dependent methyltransferase [Solirubrobacterales bacterium]|nr:class I SAM-dependent methyltransferase [Solirubrobacterales bacterium]
MTLDVAGMKQGQRAMWAAGDYPEISQRIQSAAQHVVERAGVESGHDVLDVATGSGNVAIVCAGLGAKVTGLDLTPELLDAARERATAAGVECEWVEGDAEDLPYPDGSFDRVLSTFGTMFAPRHEIAAAELVRVTRPGGTIAVAAWTPEGGNGQMFKTVAQHLPPPPEAKRPTMWGEEQYMRDLFGPHGVDLEFERGNVVFESESPEAWLEYNERTLGPMVLARAALEPQGKWEALRQDLVDLYRGFNLNDDGSFRAEGEYLVTVARVPE